MKLSLKRHAMHQFEHRVSSYCVPSPPYRYEPKDSSSPSPPIVLGGNRKPRLAQRGAGLSGGEAAQFGCTIRHIGGVNIHIAGGHVDLVVLPLDNILIRDEHQLHP